MAKAKQREDDGSGGGGWKWIIAIFAGIVYGNLDAYDRLVFDLNHEDQIATVIEFWCDEGCDSGFEIDVSLIGAVASNEIYDQALPDGVHRISSSRAFHDAHYIGDQIVVGVAKGTIMQSVRYFENENERALNWYNAIVPLLTIGFLFFVGRLIFSTKKHDDEVTEVLEGAAETSEDQHPFS